MRWKDQATRLPTLGTRPIRALSRPWILLACLLPGLLLVAAVSYFQGTRYALVPEPGAALSAVHHAAGAHSPGPAEALLAAELRHAPSSVPVPGQPPAADGRNSPCPDDSPRHHTCCDRYPAPRSEPAPTKAAAPDPPALALPAGQRSLLPSGPPQAEPRRQALTLDQLSISRT